MSFAYFKAPSGEVFGYDADEQQSLIAAAIGNGWEEITGNWPPAPSLDQVQALRIASIYESYAEAIAQPVSYTSKGGVTKTFQADPDSIDNVLRMLNAYSGTQITPTGFYWKSEDNTEVPFTYADLQGLAAAMGDQGWAAFQKFQGYKAQINAVAVTATQTEAQAVAAVLAITWS